MSDIGFGPVGDPPIIHGGNSYVTRDGYGRPTYLVDRRLLEKAEARIAELEDQLRPMSPLRQQADTYLRILRHPEIYRHLRAGAGSWSDQIDARITTVAADRDHWRAEAEKARDLPAPDAGNPEHLRFAANILIDRALKLGVKFRAEAALGPFNADELRNAARRLESEATADDVVERIARELYRRLYPGPIGTHDSARTRESDAAEMDMAYRKWDEGREGFAPGRQCREIAAHIAGLLRGDR
ncbi:hypothetical protein [Gordonia westfalica]|uniref:Uncharacterized protein n=1 Tax=Gordonia westfalica TaxID=158898 RepID=A0A1H2DT03_9ACTN|nr:hypothetical protein [Gordonia westfalica]SDT84477.1 hypothetical protein SAMN04488548_10916 [Gordonia westfalica]SDT84511.1 hypothetical protein SAMN04488548_10934 [Gordonia westfalica]SDT85848.1 hypothetical protein SAMN04488548_1218 [Gordonia westfalica]SDT85875.1 hypothetical protein SAMN04488548_12113 [Gordonia westfalica]SDT85985.1 hypothetical protein SAMN04488548_12134 [Gordonia westfalica]